MKNIKVFQKNLKTNRKKVIESGFKASIVSMWINGNRTPSWEKAVKLSILLDMPISEIPYRKIELNQ